MKRRDFLKHSGLLLASAPFMSFGLNNTNINKMMVLGFDGMDPHIVHDMVKRGHGKKVVRDSWLKHKDDVRHFYIFKPRPTSEDVVNPEDKGLCYCSSVPSGIDLALQMGCKNVFVLGLDHVEYRGKHHFWQYMDKKPKQLKPAQCSWKKQQEVFDFNIQALDALEKFAEYKNAKIYNVNRTEEDGDNWITRVESFDIISMNQVEKIVR